MKLSAVIHGDTEGDLALALEEIRTVVEQGFTSGHNRNETGSYNFEIDEEGDSGD